MVVPNSIGDDPLDPSEPVGDRFDRTNVELVAGNKTVVCEIIADVLFCKVDLINVEPVAGTRIVVRGIP